MTTHFACLHDALVAVIWIAGQSPIRKPELAFSEFLYNSFSVSVLGCPKDIFVLIY
jgi:hypothetical protein